MFCQKEHAPYTLFKEKIVAYSDLGFTSSPYTIKFKSAITDVDKLKFKNNHGLALGFGISYKWFSLRIAFPVIRNIKPIDQFGKTRFIDIGLDFPVKKMYFELDFRNYAGYSIKNAADWNKNLPSGQQHEIRQNASTLTIALNGWYFFNKDFKMNSLKGKVGHYNKEVHTWYLKNSVNIQGVSDVESIIPLQLTDSLTTKNRATTISAFDFGSIPGFAYVNRKKQLAICRNDRFWSCNSIQILHRKRSNTRLLRTCTPLRHTTHRWLQRSSVVCDALRGV